MDATETRSRTGLGWGSGVILILWALIATGVIAWLLISGKVNFVDDGIRDDIALSRKQSQHITEGISRLDRFAAMTEKTESDLNKIRQDTAAASEHVERSVQLLAGMPDKDAAIAGITMTMQNLSQKIDSINSAREPAIDRGPAIKRADALFSEKNYREASFYYAYALEGAPVDMGIIDKYATSIEALVQSETASGSLERAQQALDQYQLFLSEKSLAVPFNDIPAITRRLNSVATLQSSLDAALEKQTLPATNDAAYLRGQVGPLTAITAKMTDEQLQDAVAMRESILEIAEDAPDAMPPARLEALRAEIRVAQAILFERQAGTNFQRLWEQAEREAKRNPEIAAFILQNGEALLRQRIEIKDQLPEAMQKSIADDYARLNRQSRELMDRALAAADSPFMNEINRTLDNNQQMVQRALNNTLGGTYQSNITHIESVMMQLARDMSKLKYSENIEAVSPKLEEYRKALGVLMNKQMGAYNTWAVRAIENAWKSSVDHMGLIGPTTNKKEIANQMDRNMADIDTNLLNRDAMALYQLVYEKLFAALDDPKNKDSNSADTNKMYVLEKFLKTSKRELSAF